MVDAKDESWRKGTRRAALVVASVWIGHGGAAEGRRKTVGEETLKARNSANVRVKMDD
jgi:hypothetical protein